MHADFLCWLVFSKKIKLLVKKCVSLARPHVKMVVKESSVKIANAQLQAQCKFVWEICIQLVQRKPQNSVKSEIFVVSAENIKVDYMKI